MHASLVLSAVLIACATSVHAVTYKAYYKGIPDYEHTVVFLPDLVRAHEELRAALRKAPSSGKLCQRGEVRATVVDPQALRTNICDSSAYSSIKRLLAQLAPSLDERRLTFRKVDLDRDREPELLVEYIDLIGDEQRFKLEAGKTEWWVFTCNDLNCDHEMSLGVLPEGFSSSWKAGRKL